MNTDLMFSSATDQWATPQDFFDKLNDEFHFTLDVAADETNHKCEKYYDKQMDGLSQPWAIPEREREYGAIHHMVVKLVNGLRKHTMNH
jgi:phage N-6-adenine-methyltransferase